MFTGRGFCPRQGEFFRKNALWAVQGLVKFIHNSRDNDNERNLLTVRVTECIVLITTG